ncbi:hypothetical protein CIP107509_02338 [Corynebacterium diphtheriae]|nr:hypothetical protein CIP107524_02233 [Corynebacterium diphtheriae]CAB0575215.1 hypothetical protein CIP107509_02338 [Corynebacterium diphtheriae]CAB0620379.1 hypothetical protein CIP107559_02272 [Corynebacterium diphtheriae]CAB0620595.1 hypothetical protein CIP107552_02286 [Corynebacterium diphtheriae]CAB0624193.1 hypothetical protein CIP107544_02366 [Corynebacterium diphtheriae]
MGYPVLPFNPILSSPLHGQLSRNTGLHEAVSVALESCQESLRLSNSTKNVHIPFLLLNPQQPPRDHGSTQAFGVQQLYEDPSEAHTDEHPHQRTVDRHLHSLESYYQPHLPAEHAHCAQHPDLLFTLNNIQHQGINDAQNGHQNRQCQHPVEDHQ